MRGLTGYAIGEAYAAQTIALAAASQDYDGPTCEDCGDELADCDGTTPVPSICDACYLEQAPAVAA